jgi:hypothetical protein
MTDEAKALTQVLLHHHRNVCVPANDPHDPDLFTIPYKTLCERAGVPWLTQEFFANVGYGRSQAAIL